jgi:hypothetical protein
LKTGVRDEYKENPGSVLSTYLYHLLPLPVHPPILHCSPPLLPGLLPAHWMTTREGEVRTDQSINQISSERSCHGKYLLNFLLLFNLISCFWVFLLNFFNLVLLFNGNLVDLINLLL